MRRAIHPLVVVAFAVLAACRPVENTENPDDTAALEDLERTPPGAGADPEAATPAGPAVDKSKPVPKVRDRDPEEEKKKLALSRQRSAEAAKHLEAGRLVEAIDHSRQALKIHEQNVDAMLVMAEAYYRQKKFELVQAVTSSALAVDAKVRSPQETSRAHNLKGFAYAKMGQDNLATQSFKLAAEADEKNASAWNNLGTRYMQAGDTATAKQCFSYALELDPRFAKAHVNLGAAQRADGKVEDAEKSLQTALKLRPNYPEAYFNLGVLYLDADPYPKLETIARLEKAISYLTKYRELAIADGPDGPTGSGSGKKGPTVASGPASVSHARAEDYIRVAKKGIEREQRKIDRGKTRDDSKGTEPDPKPPTAPGAASPADAAPGADAAPDDGAPQTDPAAPLSPSKPGGAASPKPGTPTPSKPGQPKTPGGAATPSTPAEPSPAKPTPSKPGQSGGAATPSTPTTPPPAAPTSKPTPSKPAPSAPAAPSTPAPSKPAEPTPPPAKPAPTEPAVKPTPVQPAPVKPTPVQPAPVKPTPVKPATPTAPAPDAPGVQKPGVQKPGAVAPKSAMHLFSVTRDRLVAWNPRRCADTHADAHAQTRACATMTMRCDRDREASLATQGDARSDVKRDVRTEARA